MPCDPVLWGGAGAGPGDSCTGRSASQPGAWRTSRPYHTHCGVASEGPSRGWLWGRSAPWEDAQAGHPRAGEPPGARSLREPTAQRHGPSSCSCPTW